MCEFFSFVSDNKGERYYFDKGLREKLKDTSYNMDSHTSICDYFKLDEDKCNKYEYIFNDKKFRIDQINTKDDSIHCKKWIESLDEKFFISILPSKDAYWYCLDVRDRK